MKSKRLLKSGAIATLTLFPTIALLNPVNPAIGDEAPQSTLVADSGKEPGRLEADEQAIRQLSQEWIEQGFSPGDNAENYTYAEYLERFYDNTPGTVTLHDNNDPQMRIETDARTYGRIWEDLFANLDFVGNKLTRFFQVEVDGDLALSSFTADAIVVPKNGERVVVPVFYTLGWRRTDEGWRIIHEHGSNLVTNKSPVGQQPEKGK